LNQIYIKEREGRARKEKKEEKRKSELKENA
jgi:hypothetical protein